MNGISIGFDPESGVYVTSQFEKELVMNDDEQKIAEHFIAAIRAAAPAASFPSNGEARIIFRCVSV